MDVHLAAVGYWRADIDSHGHHTKRPGCGRSYVDWGISEPPSLPGENVPDLT